MNEKEMIPRRGASAIWIEDDWEQSGLRERREESFCPQIAQNSQILRTPAEKRNTVFPAKTQGREEDGTDERRWTQIFESDSVNPVDSVRDYFTQRRRPAEYAGGKEEEIPFTTNKEEKHEQKRDRAKHGK